MVASSPTAATEPAPALAPVFSESPASPPPPCFKTTVTRAATPPTNPALYNGAEREQNARFLSSSSFQYSRARAPAERRSSSSASASSTDKVSALLNNLIARSNARRSASASTEKNLMSASPSSPVIIELELPQPFSPPSSTPYRHHPLPLSSPNSKRDRDRSFGFQMTHSPRGSVSASSPRARGVPPPIHLNQLRERDINTLSPASSPRHSARGHRRGGSSGGFHAHAQYQLRERDLNSYSPSSSPRRGHRRVGSSGGVGGLGGFQSQYPPSSPFGGPRMSPRQYPLMSPPRTARAVPRVRRRFTFAVGHPPAGSTAAPLANIINQVRASTPSATDTATGAASATTSTKKKRKVRRHLTLTSATSASMLGAKRKSQSIQTPLDMGMIVRRKKSLLASKATDVAPKTVRLRSCTILPNPMSQEEELEATFEVEEIRYATIKKLDTMMSVAQASAKELLLEDEGVEALHEVAVDTRAILLQAAPDLRDFFARQALRRRAVSGAEATPLEMGRATREREIVIPLHDLMVALCNFVDKEIKKYEPCDPNSRIEVPPLPRRVADFVSELRHRVATFTASRLARQEFRRCEVARIGKMQN